MRQQSRIGEIAQSEDKEGERQEKPQTGSGKSFQQDAAGCETRAAGGKWKPVGLRDGDLLGSRRAVRPHELVSGV